MRQRRQATPKRGDIIKADFDPTQGHEQSGFRAALVLSNELFNDKTSLVIVCLMTTSEKEWPFKVTLSPGSHALADQVRTIDWRERETKVVGTADPLSLKQVLEMIDRIIQ